MTHNFARMYTRYKYKSEQDFLNFGNIGDCIQNIAVENLYRKIGILPTDLTLINRDELPSYSGAHANLVMQSWFGHTNGTFPLPWSDNITPIFLGFHINSSNGGRDMFVAANVPEKMRKFEPIGCRDRNTRDFLRSFGLDAYFSGCLTLTLDKRTKKPTGVGKTFVVDLNPKALARLPRRIRKRADFSITHLYQFNTYPISENDAIEFENAARKILQRYRDEAGLVITSRIHVAMPCVAMGIPVVFITDRPRDERFDVLRGILPVYSYRDMGWVKWHPVAPDISKLKESIINNAIAQITQQNTKTARQELDKITDQLQTIKPVPMIGRVLRKIFK